MQALAVALMPALTPEAGPGRMGSWTDDLPSRQSLLQAFTPWLAPATRLGPVSSAVAHPVGSGASLRPPAHLTRITRVSRPG